MAIKKLLLIYNPKAGKAMMQKELHHIVNFYTAKGWLTTVYPTQKAGDASTFMENCREDYDLVVAAGGDGTINEVISGMAKSEKSYPLGYLPMGSTNDFSVGIGLDQGLEHALETSLSGRMTALDLGQLNGRQFLYVAAFGLFTNVPYSTPQNLKNNLGYVAYFLQGAKELADVKTFHLTVSTEDQCIEGDYCVGLVTNSFSVSGFKNSLSQMTKLNDGLLEGIFVGMPQNIFEFNGIVSSFLSGNLDHPKIQVLQFKEIHLCGDELSWTLDGEYGGTYDDAVIKVQPEKLVMRIFDDGNLQDKLLLPENEITEK